MKQKIFTFFKKIFPEILFSFLSFLLLTFSLAFTFNKIVFALCEDDCLHKNKPVVKEELMKKFEKKDFILMPVGPISNVL